MRPLMLVCAITAAPLSGCSSSTEAEPRFDWANITLISGANQNVTVNQSGLTPLPELVVVRADSLGTPMEGAEVRATARMSGAPGPNGPQYFVTDGDGVASMQLHLSNPKGPVVLTVEYVMCDKVGWFACEHYRTLATVNVPGIVAQ